MADDRTRRQKLEAMAADSGATEGERANARDLLAKMGPEPVVTASESVEPFDWDALFDAMGGGVIGSLHDAGILISWDENGICTICRRRH